MDTFVNTFITATIKGLIVSTLPVIIVIIAWLTSGCSFYLVYEGFGFWLVPVASCFLFVLFFLMEVIVSQGE
jgi:hypothetical protein